MDRRTGTVLREARRVLHPHGLSDVSDAALLDGFRRGDGPAFALIVRRHGPMVLGVCQRLLRDAHAAEDACQAVFLVLARKADGIRGGQALPHWLYQVAVRVAVRARTTARARRERRLGAAEEAAVTTSPPDDRLDLRDVLDEEVARLPEKYRHSVVLRYFQGKSTEEAARELGWPTGSLTWRLSKALDLLRRHLARRGVTLAGASLAALLADQAAPAAVSSSLVEKLTAAALATLTGQSLVGTGVSAASLRYTESMVRSMTFHKFRRAAALLAALFLVGGGGLAWWASAAPTAPGKPELPPVVRSAQSGLWSAASTWEGGKVPAAGARVLVRGGHRVVYDRNSDQAVRSINLAGTLTFAPDRDTRLDVGLIKIQATEEYSEDGFDCEAHLAMTDPRAEKPALEVGAPDRPVDAKHSATIRLTYFDGMDRQSAPAIVCCGGRMDFHGAPLSHSWVKLGKDAKAGDAELVLSEAVSGWRVGDRVIVTATDHDESEAGSRRPGKRSRRVYTEERTVKAVAGDRLTLDAPLDVPHAGSGEFRGEVANLSRNVVVESAAPDGERGHTMYHRHSAGSIGYAEFRHLGKENTLGRYALHYHMVGDTMRGSSVIGASIWDSHNRWLTLHGTNYLVVRDCVGYQSVGHGFFLEDGTEAYNVLDRNLAVQAYRGKPLPKQVLPFDHNEGAGFWWANSLNTFTRNVTCENDRYGYRFEATKSSGFDPTLAVLRPDGGKEKVDVRTLPFVRFDDNEAHCDGLYGFNLGEGVDRVGPDVKHPFVIRRMKIWSVHYAFRVQSPSVLVDGLHIDRSVYGVYHPNYDHHVYRNVTINGNGSEPFNRGHDDTSIQYGPLTVDGLTFDGVKGYPTSIPLIQISDDNPTGTAASHFRNVKVVRKDANDRRPVVDTGGGAHVTPSTDKGVPVYLHDYYGPNRHAKVAAVNARDYAADGLKYREEAPLTGHEARVAEVADVEFPKLLDPVDDLPPATVVTHVARDGDRLVVRGTTAANGAVKRVLVNGKEARPLADNFAEWEATVGAASKLEAFAEGAALVEKRPHVVVVPRPAAE